MEGDAWRAFDLVRKGHLDRLTVCVSSVCQALVDTANGLLPIEGMHRMASAAGGDAFAPVPGERVVTYFDEDGNVVAPAVDEIPQQ
jgi:hypothetical protein